MSKTFEGDSVQKVMKKFRGGIDKVEKYGNYEKRKIDFSKGVTFFIGATMEFMKVKNFSSADFS